MWHLIHARGYWDGKWLVGRAGHRCNAAVAGTDTRRLWNVRLAAWTRSESATGSQVARVKRTIWRLERRIHVVGKKRNEETESEETASDSKYSISVDPNLPHDP